jgi:predicted flap endonuclease-1-like 5' DNA nuclease
MSNVLSTVLITAPLAFMLGWLLAKAVFRHLSITRPGADLAGDHEASAASAAGPADSPEIDLSTTEVQLLREGVAERDHVIADLKKQLATQLSPLEDTPANASAQESRLRQNITAMREGLTTREKQLQKLQTRLAERQEKSLQRFRLWRARFSKAANQIRQQKLIISELREELKLREQRQPEPVTSSQPAPAVSTLQASAVTAMNCDELRALRGVGPAMQFKLNEQGIYRLQQIASLSMAELLQLGDTLSINRVRMEKTDWISQARTLLNLPAADNQPVVTTNEVAVAI